MIQIQDQIEIVEKLQSLLKSKTNRQDIEYDEALVIQYLSNALIQNFQLLDALQSTLVTTEADTAAKRSLASFLKQADDAQVTTEVDATAERSHT